jgi:hypothetical protein
VKGEARRLLLAAYEEKLGASPSLSATSHSIALPSSMAILNRIVALGSISPRSMAGRCSSGLCQRCRADRCGYPADGIKAPKVAKLQSNGPHLLEPATIR